jgi:glycosyltransferase involved in cell wall biosynthesis
MITILLPIYNGIEYIEESVTSVLNQTFQEWELLIGVNGHPPVSEVFQTAKQYEKKDNLKRIRAFNLYHIKGKVDTLHELLKHAKYDLVALIDVDDIWLKNKLEKQIKYINEYDVIGTHTHYFGEADGVPLIPFYDISKINFINANPIINSSVLLKKKLCCWDKKYEGVEDYELWLRLRKQNNKFYNLPDILTRHRIHKTSQFNTQNHDEKLKSLMTIYK